MTRTITLLRLSYWTAATADFYVAIVTWIPERMGLPETAYPMGLASVIAFSWAVMLLIADRKPVERRWVLIPTILVVALILTVRTLYSLGGTIDHNWTLLLFGVALIVLMTFSYYRAGVAGRESGAR
jgi:ABC-type Na+ efflux pump permease subunit